MSTLKDRIKEIMEARNLAIGEVAKAAGVSSSAVSQWLGKGNGKTIQQIANIEAAYGLEVATGYRALWIAVGKGPKLTSDAPAPIVVSAPAEPMDPFAHAMLHAFNELPDDPVTRGQAFISIMEAIKVSRTEEQRQHTSVR